VVISDEKIDYPKVIAPDILLVMSQEAFNRYAEGVKEGGAILVDEDMVPDIPDDLSARVYKVPATRLAFEELGRRIVANMVMLGALVGITSVVSEDALTKTVLESVPKGTEDLNRRALALGLKAARETAEAPSAGGGTQE
jgi:2-oxoglutarate ferredoxin oxidoreductase subunit gamma